MKRPFIVVWGLMLLSAAIVKLCAVVPLTLAWDPNPSDQQVIVYNIYGATTVTGVWTLQAIVSGTLSNYTLQVDNSHPAFFYVTASNFWGESNPSNITNSPSVTSKVQNPQLHK